MENQKKNICAICGLEIAEGNAAMCTGCGAVYHISCREQHATCPCCAPETPTEQIKQEEPVTVKEVCESCGTEFIEGMNFCPKCGRSKLAPEVSAVNVGFAPPAQPMPKKKNTTAWIVAGVCAVAAIILAVVLLGGGTKAGEEINLRNIYNEYCSSIWADIGSDGSYLSVDTNPYDEDDNGMAYYEAYLAVSDINDALELPESLIHDMEQTTGADGKQSETFEELGLTVSWKYHPDSGLEVTYKKVNNK